MYSMKIYLFPLRLRRTSYSFFSQFNSSNYSTCHPQSISRSRQAFWNKKEFQIKTNVAKTYQTKMIVLSKLPNTVLPIDIFNLLLKLPDFQQNHLLYIIQERSQTHFHPTGRWVIRLSHDPLPYWINYLNNFNVSGHRIKYQVMKMAHKQESTFIHPFISTNSGKLILLKNVPSLYSKQDLFQFFQKFALAPIDSQDPYSAVQIIKNSTSSRYLQVLLHLQTENDAYQVLRACHSQLIPRWKNGSSSSTSSTIPYSLSTCFFPSKSTPSPNMNSNFIYSYKAKLSILYNIVSFHGWPHGYAPKSLSPSTCSTNQSSTCLFPSEWMAPLQPNPSVSLFPLPSSPSPSSSDNSSSSSSPSTSSFSSPP